MRNAFYIISTNGLFSLSLVHHVLQLNWYDKKAAPREIQGFSPLAFNINLCAFLIFCNFAPLDD